MGVIEEVINSVREAFADEGVDEQILQELKQSWDRRLRESKVLEPAPSTDTVPGASPGAGGGAGTASNSAPNSTSNNVGNSGNSGNTSKAKKDNPMMAAGQQSRNWQPQPSLVAQVDGPHDSSDEDGDDDEDIDNDDDRDENDDEQNDEENEGEDDQVLIHFLFPFIVDVI